MSNQLESRISKLEAIETEEDASAQFLANLKALSDGTPAPYPNLSKSKSNELLIKTLRQLHDKGLT